MYRSTLTAVAVAGMLVLGCDKSETEKAKENNADAVNNQLEQAKEKTQDAASEMKKAADNREDAAKNEADKTADATKNQAEAVKDQIEDLVGKAKDAVKNAKWDDAQNYVDQIDTLKQKLPEGARAPIDNMLSDVRKGIESGKKMTMPKM